MTHPVSQGLRTTLFGAVATAALTLPAAADQVFIDDVIVQGSLCVGVDCINNENFGFDTIRLKENNLRIRALDTSNSGSFPTADWQITFNDSANGGQNKFSIDDIDYGSTPFTIEASVRSHQLYLADNNKVGFGTNLPETDLHVKQGNTPTLRLEQDVSSGFTAQTWDVAGNEAGFFVRDVTNGSTLPFRIIPGASSQSLVIDDDDDVGIGAGINPTASLHVSRNDGTAKILVEETTDTAGPRGLLELKNNGLVFLTLTDTAVNGGTWNIQNRGSLNANELRITNAVNPGEEFVLAQNGNLTISGSLVTGGTQCGGGCDRVFTADYTLPSIAEHNAQMWANGYLPNVGPTIENEPINLTEKLGRMLNELEHAHIFIGQLNDEIETLRLRLEELESEKG